MMQSPGTTADAGRITAQRAARHFHAYQQRLFKSTDRLFAALMVIQWFAGIAAAVWLSPRTWAGESSQTHLHVYAAIFLGGAINSLPITLALTRPGQVSTRYTIAIGQMLMSALLIHLTGGRIETHFHLFGSLAFLAFYRDWRVLIPATIVTALDHLIRGAFWPQSLYGVLSASEWRWVEHLGWVLFIDIFLFISCRRGAKELWGIAERQASLEMVNEHIEQQVLGRTADLQASEQRFRLISAAAPIGIFQMDAEGHCIYTNAHWQALSGLTLEESLDEGWLSALHPEDRQPVFTKWTSTIPEGAEFMGEFRFQNKQGEIHWVDARAKAYLTEEGKPNGYVGTVTDITERKRAENALKQSEERFRTIIEKMTDDYWELDLTGSLTFFNNQMMKSTRRSREELMGLNNRQYMDEENIKLVGKVYKQIYLTGEPVRRVLYETIRGDGTKWVSESNVSLITDSAGKPVGFRGISRDVTERIQAEAELQKAKEVAEAASHAKSEFLANMSHEIRTPMNGIIGMTELTLDTEMTAEQREYVGLIKTSADSLLTVINDILDFSKIEAGKLSLDPVPFDLRECIEETIKTLALRAHEKGLELACQVRPDVPEAVIGDPARLRQIIVNLVGNAIKFTKQGEVAVEVAVEVGSGEWGVRGSEFANGAVSSFPTPHSPLPTPEEICLHFTVRDTGIGIPVEKQARIFDAFTQADGSTTRHYGGTGLGLTISSQLVALMGGRIWVESAVGEGSAFHFTARFEDQLNPVTKSSVSELADFIGLPVLVVDDNATNRRILEGTLVNWKMKPVVVEGGQAALMTMRQAHEAGEPFALALLDCHMPEMDGFTLAAEIMRRPALAGTPLIMLTSAGQTRDCDRLRAVGIAACLTKPVKQSELLNTILQTLSKPLRTLVRPVRATGPVSIEGGRSLRILLAEDNVVNQRLAIRLLEKQGHTIVVVNNGREAVSALEGGGFDLALMDVQMPEMSGLEATAQIREWERATGAHLPIIAMTAYAMKGDRERCLDAGMDDYVSKPIQSAELFKVMAELTSGRPAAARAEQTEPPAEVFDQAAALSLVEGDQDLLAELAALFASDCPQQLAELRQAIADGESRKVERAAHTLKGTASNFGGRKVVALARQLEEMGRAGNVIEAELPFNLLEAEVERLNSALSTFIGKNMERKPDGAESVAV